jgi:mannose-6-phosphate isomerase-like protein (cupin superfamily)
MIIVHGDNAPGVETAEPFRRTLKVLLSPLLHPGLDSLAAGFTILPPGGMSEVHGHSEGEMFFVCSGTGLIRVGDEIGQVSPDTAVWGPPDVPHQLINNSRETLKILWILCPPGREAAILHISDHALD